MSCLGLPPAPWAPCPTPAPAFWFTALGALTLDGDEEWALAIESVPHDGVLVEDTRGDIHAAVIGRIVLNDGEWAVAGAGQGEGAIVEINGDPVAMQGNAAGGLFVVVAQGDDGNLVFDVPGRARRVGFDRSIENNQIYGGFAAGGGDV